MKDGSCTVGKLKSEVIEMCRRKGWGDDGIQNPQHVAMAMLVETMELMEHFVDLDETGERALISGLDQAEITEIAEELADVLMYALQLMYTLNVDISAGVSPDFSDGATTVEKLRKSVGRCAGGLKEQVMRAGIKGRFVLEAFQWMDDGQVAALTRGEMPVKSAEAGRAFADMFRELLCLANMLDIDISRAIARKIAIVDRRVYPEDDPVR